MLKVPKNFNVGIMGHVDAGKTTLARFISTQASTAAFDKSPQSQERGITLDLGFSSIKMGGEEGDDELQVTLVDCPGHASLLRSVIGAAQIIDAIILVIDVTKGIQTQTAECIVLAEIVTSRIIVALTKVDLFQAGERKVKVATIVEKLQRTLNDTKFTDCNIIPISERLPETKEPFLAALQSLLPIRHKRDWTGPTMMAIDHCFMVKGHGIVMTGTILQGSISVGDKLELPISRTTIRIRTIQSFKRTMTQAGQGDRVGIGVIGDLNANNHIERAVLVTPGYLRPANAFLMDVNPIKHYRQPYRSKAKLHISILHETTIGVINFLRPIGEEYEYLEEISHDTCRPIFAFITLASSIMVPPGSLVVTSKLDTDLTSKACRIAFHGNVMENFHSSEKHSTILGRVFRWKKKTGLIDRIISSNQLIGKDLSKNIYKLIGQTCELVSKETDQIIGKGIIESAFGTKGKFNLTLLGSPSQSLDTASLKLICRIKVFH